jgi:hypothetical protein
MGKRQATRMFIKAPDEGLESTLARTLASAFSESAVVVIGDPEPEDSGDIVVTTDGASSPDEVSDLTERGEQVVVLAALPDDISEARYRRAGARAYLPMVAAVSPLVAAVSVLMTSIGHRV